MEGERRREIERGRRREGREGLGGEEERERERENTEYGNFIQ